MVSAGCRVGREVAYDLLFGNLSPAAAANALSKALSMAREALLPLGEEVPRLLRADRAHVWLSQEVPVEIDLVAHEGALRAALGMEPGSRDAALCSALSEHRTLLEDEPYADWAVHPREALELLRQRARLELARDRTRGLGRARPAEVVEAWENCLSHDPASEEAASALVRVYTAAGQRGLASGAYERCRAALEELGLRPSPALEEVRRAIAPVRPATSGLGPGPATSSSISPPPLRHEQRFVSALFAQLTAFAGAGQRPDPEELRETVEGALAAVISEVEALGGMVTSVSGTGLVALFGAPAVHEDDPERAVRAAYRGLSSVGRASEVGGREALSVRIGIETGRAVVGPLRVGTASSYEAIGEVVTIAAALQSAASSGTVLVGPATRAATESIFDWGPSEEVPVAGTKPLTCWYLDRPKPRRSGYHPGRRPVRQARLVGRRRELSTLEEGLRAATSGQGSVAFVMGAPGLGKTRLVQECRRRFMAWVGAGTGRLPLWLEGYGASYASSVPFGLYQQLLSAWAGVAPEEGEEAVRLALGTAMRALFGRAGEYDAWLGQLMGLGLGPGQPDLARLGPEAVQRATFAAMRAVVARLAQAGPTVLVLEDLHWADPISLRLTQEVAAVASDAPLLLLATRRPEPDQGVTALESSLMEKGTCPVRRVELAPLSTDEERELARSLFGGAADEDVIEMLCTNVDGNPLVLEERFSSLVETGVVVRHQSRWSVSGVPQTDVPELLERQVQARLDRLAPTLRDVVTAASVLGREFSFSALEAVAPSSAGLPAALEQLCTAGLLGEVQRAPEPVYRFRHALIQDATYWGMLRGQRRRLHARAAWGLEERSAYRLTEVAAVLGHHYAAAGETDRALHYLEVAADHAASVYANDEAVASYRGALAMMDEPPARANFDDSSFRLRLKLAHILGSTGKFAEACDVVREALNRATPCDRTQSARLYTQLGTFETAAHHYEAAGAALDAAEDLLGEHPEDEGQDVVDVWLEIMVDRRPNLYYWQDKAEKAVAVLAKVRPVVEARGTALHKRTFYMNLAVMEARRIRRVNDELLANARTALALGQGTDDERDLAYVVFILGYLLLWHGDLAEAQEKLETSLRMSERTGDPVLRARCFFFLSVVALRRHDVRGVSQLSAQALAAAEATAFPELVAAAKAAVAWVAWREGRSEEVARLAGSALELWRATPALFSWWWVCLWPLVAVRLEAGDVAEAIAAARELLVPPQHRLPDKLESLVGSAVAAWEALRPEDAHRELAEALELACRSGYA